ncbi:MAG: hypothetical protein V5A27_04175, partial [Halapricum sp.]
ILRAREIQNAAGPDARANYLEAHGIPTGYKRFITKRPDRRSGNSSSTNDEIGSFSADDGTGQGDFCVEPNKCDGDIDLSLAISYDMYNARYYVSLSMRYYYLYQDMYDGPLSPLDGAGIMWERDHWKLQNRMDLTDSIYGDDHVAWDNGSWNYEGAGYRVNSEKIAKESGDSYYPTYSWSDTEYAGVYLRQGSDYEEGDQIHASYTYTWFGSGLNGISVSYPWAISLSFSNPPESEDLQTDLDSMALIVEENDAH